MISGNGDLIKSRNWFEVYEVDNPTKVEQIGFIELVLDTSGGGPTYPVHHSSTIYGYPMNRGSSFNWFRFSHPLNLEAGKPQPLPGHILPLHSPANCDTFGMWHASLGSAVLAQTSNV